MIGTIWEFATEESPIYYIVRDRDHMATGASKTIEEARQICIEQNKTRTDSHHIESYPGWKVVE